MTAETLPSTRPSPARSLREKVRVLERELDAAIATLESMTLAELRDAGAEFRRRTHPEYLRHLLSLPFIYGMAFPLVLLDLCISVYQHVCFRLYGIPRVARADFFVIDRHRLPYLHPIEKAHCVYCGYANGLLAYAREIAARTEQFWCPIEHAHHARGTHARARGFVAYGDATGFESRQDELRHSLSAEDPSTADPKPATSATQE